MEALRERLAVKQEGLRRRLDPATLRFRTTAEVAPIKTTIGQPLAAEDRLREYAEQVRELLTHDHD